MADEVKVKIGKAPENEVAIIPPGGIKEKFEKIDQVLFGIIIVLILSSIAIIVSVIGLFLDQMRYNNAAYREYSDKIEVVNTTQATNKQLLEQNKENQDMILGQQKLLLELLGEKKQNTPDNKN
jgi:hypothetical protein